MPPSNHSGEERNNPYEVLSSAQPIQSGFSAEFSMFEALRTFPGIQIAALSQYGVNLKKLSSLAKSSQWQEIFAAYLIPDIVLKPTAVWQEPNETLCFAGHPSGDFANSAHLGRQITILENKILVCFVSLEGSVSYWVWENLDSDGSGFPTNHRIHRGKLIWTTKVQQHS